MESQGRKSEGYLFLTIRHGAKGDDTSRLCSDPSLEGESCEYDNHPVGAHTIVEAPASFGNSLSPKHPSSCRIGAGSSRCGRERRARSDFTARVDTYEPEKMALEVAGTALAACSRTAAKLRDNRVCVVNATAPRAAGDGLQGCPEPGIIGEVGIG